MNDLIQVYYHPQSRSRIVHWMLEELGQPYELKLLEFTKNEHKSEEYLRLNPMGKVPAIVHRGTVVTETPAICAYLADAFPQSRLAPATTAPERGTYYRWLFFAAGPIEIASSDKGFPRAAPPRASSIGYGTHEQTLMTIERALAPGPYLLGDQFTAADVYLGSQLSWGIAFKWLEPRPAFLRYLEICKARPAYQRAEAAANEMAAQLNK